MINRIRDWMLDNEVIFKLAIIMFFTLAILIIANWLIDKSREVETPMIVISSGTSIESVSTSSSSASMLPQKPTVVPLKEVKAPEVVKDTTCQQKVYKLAKGSILYKYIELVMKEVGYNCQKTRIVFALAYAESGLCSHQTGYNCWGVFRKGKLKRYSSFENAISNLNEDIGKFIKLSDSQLIANKSYCAGACTDWRRNVTNALNKMK